VTFEQRALPSRPDVVAPDGSEVRILCSLPAGSLIHFTLGAGECSVAVRHRTVDEIWYFLSGTGDVWRRRGPVESVVPAQAGLSLTIPQGTEFQFRASSAGSLVAIAVTMPPWPGDGEAIAVSGCWPPTLAPGPGLTK
jgi:mannose-6-phosphate isomerase-like protein (cupin superfamily)